MRVKVPGVRRQSTPLKLRYEGREIDAFPGETVMSALVAAGIWTFRETRDGDCRGPFCGMGVCGECTVSAAGVPRRACLEPVSDGLEISRQPARAAAPGTSPALREDPWEDIAIDVLVVGAGPAGLAAARTAAEGGASVLVVDERRKAGGQYFKQPGEGFDIEEADLDHQFAEGRALAAAAVRAGAGFLFGATVWGAFGPDEIGVHTDDRCLLIRPRRLVLSPGAYEQPLPVPGWTLPGVLTTGAAQTLLRAYQTVPGRRMLVAGNGPLNLQVARELRRAGVDVVAVAESAPPPGPRLAWPLLRMAAASPGLVAAGIGHVLALRAARVPVLHRHVLVEATGDDRVTYARVAPIGPDGHVDLARARGFDVDAVCMGYGFLPQAELARALGCSHGYDADRGALVAERALDGRTDVDGVFIAGDAGALGGARVAIAQGTLAAASALSDLGVPIGPAPRRRRAAAMRQARRHLRFQAALWRVYRAPSPGLSLTRGDTLVCRCENVTRAAIESRMHLDHVTTLGAIKRLTRAGMGRCQGRYCAPVLARMAREAGLEIVDDDAFFAPRAPFKPVPIARLARPGPVRPRAPVSL